MTVFKSFLAVQRSKRGLWGISKYSITIADRIVWIKYGCSIRSNYLSQANTPKVINIPRVGR